MRLRAGLILFVSFLVVLVIGGCRKPLAPTFDRNQAPETWITAAPLDTITYRDGVLPRQTDPAFIPFRYHLYWAGADIDGKVAGYYFAVVETLVVPVPPATEPPPLPGPKPRDYHFTTKTDSVFIFSVSDSRTDRQHAFYIFAVDNHGKADPTPARFIFNAIDRYPPLAVIDKFIATGFVWTQDPTTLALSRVIRSDTLAKTDTFAIGARPKKTVPNNSRLDIAWHSEITTVDNPAVGYRYRLDEPDWVNVGVSTTTLSYNTGPGDAVGPGTKVFRLRAVDRAGGARVPEATRLFEMNIPPITWFAGSDPNASVWVTDPITGEKYIPVSNWATFPDLTGISLLSRDSVRIMPSQRIPRRNFLEIYRRPGTPTDRVFLRNEYDYVDMNSWVVFFNGGFDPDSPYNVNYHSNDNLAPDSTTNPVLQIRPSNGSPVGFRSRIPVYLTPTGPLTSPSQTGLYPVFDPASVYRTPSIASYWGLSQSGQAYMFARAEDGNGAVDARIGSRPDLTPQAIVYAVDSTGSPNADQIALRPLVMTFHVNRPPTLTTTAATFVPKPNTAVPTPPIYARNFNAALIGADVDPYDPGTPVSVGTGTGSVPLRFTMRLRGPRNGSSTPGDSVTFLAINQIPQAQALNYPVSLPDSLGGTQVRVMIELCDCFQCETVPGQGRCVHYSWISNFQAPPPAILGASPTVPGPGQAILVDRKRGER